MAEEVSIDMKPSQNDIKDEKQLRIRRGRVESVDLYEIKDSELDLLEKGSPADLQLNFAIFLLSLALTSLASLLTSTFPDQITKTFFVVITVVGFVGGAYLLLAWHRNHTSLKTICKRIRERIPPEVALIEERGTDPDETEQPEKPMG